MKNLFRLPLAILMTFALIISAFASEINDTPDLPLEGDTEIVEQKGNDREPDCNPNCDLPVIDFVDEDF